MTYQFMLGTAQVIEGFLQALRFLLDFVFLPDDFILLLDNLRGALLNDTLQFYLVFLQTLQAVAEQQPDQIAC